MLEYGPFKWILTAPYDLAVGFVLSLGIILATLDLIFKELDMLFVLPGQKAKGILCDLKERFDQIVCKSNIQYRALASLQKIQVHSTG